MDRCMTSRWTDKGLTDKFIDCSRKLGEDMIKIIFSYYGNCLFSHNTIFTHLCNTIFTHLRNRIFTHTIFRQFRKTIFTHLHNTIFTHLRNTIFTQLPDHIFLTTVTMMQSKRLLHSSHWITPYIKITIVRIIICE